MIGMNSTTKLTNGTNIMDKRPFKVADLCRIIKAASTCGVTELKFGDFEVRFTNSTGPGVPEFFPGPATPLSEEQQQSEQKDMDTQTLEMLEELSREQMVVEDPLAHENELIEELLKG